MRLKILLITLLFFQLKICIANNHETIEEYLNKKIEVIRRITGSSGSYQDQEMSASDNEKSIRRQRFIEDPLQCIGSLKTVLKNRLPYASTASSTVKTLKSNTTPELHISNKRKLRTGHAKLSFSRVDKVILPYNVSSSTKQLNEELVSTNVMISDLKSSMNRSSQARADDSDASRDLDNVKIKDLVLSGSGHPFEDALISTKLMTFSDQLILQSLTTTDLRINENKINKIPLDKLLNASRTKNVAGEKLFQRLTINELTIDDRIQNIPKSSLKLNDEARLNASRKIEFQGDINVKHLKVKTINRLNFTAFMRDALLKGSENELVFNGDLITENLLNVDDLSVNLISNIPTSNFMTVNGDQTISSNILVGKFYSSSLTSSLINGEDVSSATIATTTSPNIITPRTKFMDISVTENLNVEGVQGDATKEFVDFVKRHVIGTKTSDLFQLYNGHVIIQGSLKLQNVQFQSLNSNVIVANMKIFQNLLENYWMKSIKQNILTPNFVINNEATAAANVVVGNLNDQVMEKYLLVNSERRQGKVWLRFEDAVVNGDVRGHVDNQPSRIFVLASSVVMRNSSVPIQVFGSIEFRNDLVVRRLRAGLINSNPVSSLIHNNQQTILMEAPVSVTNLITSSIFVDRDLTIETYNNVELSKFAENALKLTQGVIKIDSIIMERFDATNLQVNLFEDRSLDAMFTKFQQEFDTGAIRERTVTIHGDVRFLKNIFVERINSETIVNEFLSSLAFKTDREVLSIGGKKSFELDIEVKHLTVDNLNSYPAYRLFNQSLSRGIKQTIKVPITVRSLSVDSLHTNGINDHYWNAFISKKDLAQPILTNLYLEELSVKVLVTNFAVHDLNTMIQSVLFPKRYNWNYINVTKETTAVLTPSSELYHLFEYGVDKFSPQEILAKVNVNTDKLYMKTVLKPSMDIVTRTMAINLDYLIEDSVKNYSPHPERIKGTKIIPTRNRLDANNLKIEKTSSFHTNYIEEININQLNATLYRGGNLTGIKQFDYIHVDEFKIRNGRVNGIRVKDLITPNSNLFTANFEKLEVNELHTYSVNKYSFQYFLENRLRKYGKEQVFGSTIMMKSAHFEEDTVVPYINDVQIEACVFKKSDQMQDILPHVIVNGKVNFIGPVTIGAVNGEDFRRHLDDSISRHQPFSCNKLNLKEVELKNGLKISGIINNREIKELLESDAHSPKLVDLMSLISNIQKQEAVIDNRRSLKESSKRMMYLDIDENINTQYKVMRSNDDNEETICSGNEIDFEPHARGFMLSRKSNLLFEMPLMKAEVILPCNLNKLEVRWKNSQGQFNQTFSNYSEGILSSDVQIFQSSPGDIFMLLKASSALIVFKFDKPSNKFIEITQTAFKSLINVRSFSLIQTPQHEIYLAVLTKANEDVLIYKLTSEFVKHQKIAESIKFDIILNLNVAKSSTFLIFATTNDRKVYIYRLDRDTHQFVFQQILDETRDVIVSVIVLYINDEPFIVISKKSGIFCFYQWRGIENWQQKHCGKFRNLQLMKSFKYLNKQRIFLASNLNSNVDNSINALVIHKQGG